jgi:hypothetical protein
MVKTAMTTMVAITGFTGGTEKEHIRFTAVLSTEKMHGDAHTYIMRMTVKTINKISLTL